MVDFTWTIFNQTTACHFISQFPEVLGILQSASLAGGTEGIFSLHFVIYSANVLGHIFIPLQRARAPAGRVPGSQIPSESVQWEKSH